MDMKRCDGFSLNAQAPAHPREIVVATSNYKREPTSWDLTLEEKDLCNECFDTLLNVYLQGGFPHDAVISLRRL